MDSKTTVSDNELIALFMGRQYGKNADRNGYLKYDSSWDHLMPVVEKIEKMRCTKIGVDNEVQFNDVLNIPISAPMNNIYLCVVNFIRWFNSQSPDTIK